MQPHECVKNTCPECDLYDCEPIYYCKRCGTDLELARDPKELLSDVKSEINTASIALHEALGHAGLALIGIEQSLKLIIDIPNIYCTHHQSMLK